MKKYIYISMTVLRNFYFQVLSVRIDMSLTILLHPVASVTNFELTAMMDSHLKK